MEKITGSELVKRVLIGPNGSIEKLIELSGGTETDWLEVKSATLPKYVVENGTRRYLLEKNENDANYAWNVAKAIVAIANTHGGAVILGIDDDFNGVGLEASDKKGDLAKGQDHFARCVLDNALRPESRCWKCGKETYELTVSTYYELMEYQFGDYQGKRVAAIIVNPVPKDAPLILVEEARKSSESLLVRAVGEEGKVHRLFRRRDMEAYSLHRDPRQESYTLLYDQFLASCPSPDAPEPSEPEGLTEAIRQYQDLLRRMCAEDDKLFVSLDAEENPSFETDMELFEPMAEEYLSSDLDWLDEPQEAESGDQSSENKLKKAGNDAEDFEDFGRAARKGGVFSLLKQEPRAMLLGEPGGGKTTCLKHLALSAANQYADDKRVSLFVPLSRYKGPGDLFPLMVRATHSSKTDTGLTLAHIEWLMKYGRLQLLLDALNECPSEYTRHCVEDIQTWLNRYPSLPVTITARTYAYREQIGLPAFSVQPMDAEQQNAFLAIHLRSKERAQDIIAQLQQQAGGETLASNPLLLRLVVETVRGGQSLPTGRARLYRQFLERWYIREANKAKSAGRPLPWTIDQTLAALSQMAFHTRLAGLRSVHRDQALEFLQDAIPDPNMFIDRMAQGLVLTCDFEGMIDFLHETFQEYLAAEFLIQNPEFIERIKKTVKNKWAMTLAYSIELNPTPPLSLLEKIATLDPWLAACADNAQYLVYSNRKGEAINIGLMEQLIERHAIKSSQYEKRYLNLERIPTPALRYLLQCLPTAGKQWHKMTERILRDFGLNKKNVGIRQLKGLIYLQWPNLKRHKELILSSWPGDSMRPRHAFFIFEAGIAQAADFKDRVRFWRKSASNVDALRLVAAGWANPSEFLKPRHAISLVQAGLAQPKDFLMPKQIEALVDAGLTEVGDFKGVDKSFSHPQEIILPARKKSRAEEEVFLRNLLQTEQVREHTVQLIKGQMFTLTISCLFPPTFKSGFAGSGQFPDGVYLDTQFLPGVNELRVGDVITAEIGVTMNKRNEWGFVVKDCLLENRAERTIPRWWWAWDYFPRQFISVYKRGTELPPAYFSLVEKEGLDVECLKGWIATARDVERIRKAIQIMNQRLVKGPAAIVKTQQALDYILEGNRPLEILAKMATARLEAMQSLGELAGIASPIRNQIVSSYEESIRLPKKTKPVTSPTISRRATIKKSTIKSSKKANIAITSQTAYYPPGSPPQISQLQQRLTDFGKNYNKLTVYIDEAWPGNVCKANKPGNEGVIAGVVCCEYAGHNHSNLLPKIATHSYKQLDKATWALSNLLKCEMVFPFIFPIRLINSDEQAIKHYDKLFQQSIFLLLGWVLPQKAAQSQINIIAERIAEHYPGENETEFFKGLLHHERYEKWTIEQVRWEDKNFGYLPYADLLAHLTHEHTDQNRKLGREFRYKELPGYIPLSLKLVPMLERLEHLESIGNMEDALDLLLETDGTRFGKFVRQDLQRRIQDIKGLQEKLLVEVESRYQSKSRNLNELRRLFLFVKECIKSMPDDAPIRMRLLWMLLAFQDANHDGDPGRVQKSLKDYFLVREAAMESDRELTAYTDLNMAVHFADRFEFAEAEATVRQWISDPLFPALSSRQRGRMYSSLGQFRSMQWDHDGADHFFGKALECFESPAFTPTEKAEECDQTSVYRAINALDGGFASALVCIEAVLGNLVKAAEQLASSDDPRTFYHHHLLVRTLYQQPQDTTEARDVYLKKRPQWIGDILQHPWSLIHLYRGLLLWEHEETADEDSEWFGKAVACCDTKPLGGTLKLIGAMIATVASCCFEEEAFKEKALEWLDEIQNRLPAAGSNITGLREILKALSPEQINAALRLLPFNYH